MGLLIEVHRFAVIEETLLSVGILAVLTLLGLLGCGILINFINLFVGLLDVLQVLVLRKIQAGCC